MFLVEIGAALVAGSASLQADALDFLGDAANYVISLFIVGMAVRYRAAAGLLKGSTMTAFGVWVIGVTFCMPSTEHSPKLSPWVRLAPRRCSPMCCHSGCCGHIAKETPTCARPGSAHPTMYSVV